MRKYLIKLCRPEFKTLILEVDADCANKAVIEACKTAAQSDSQDWHSVEESGDYCLDVQMIMPTNQTSYREDRMFIEESCEIRYVSLKAECDTGEGSLVVQPWLRQQDQMLLADLLRDWQSALDETYEDLFAKTEDNGLDIELPLPARRTTRRNAKIIPFPSVGRR